MKRICVYCGSSTGNKTIYQEMARELGLTLVKNQLDLVYGGSNIGLMRIIADTVLENGGRVIGIMPKALIEKEVAHHHLTEFYEVDNMHQRKAMMARMSDGFIAMPGGFGTLDELCEILTWSQLRIIEKPIGVLNVADYYTPFLAMLDHATTESFIKSAHRKRLLSAAIPDRLIALMKEFTPTEPAGWIEELKANSK